MKKVTRYQIREYVGNDYSVILGRRLRTRKEASCSLKILKKQGRKVFASKMSVNGV
jgi:hypothetical protein